MSAELVRRLDSREACVGVVGLGYVGLPVAVSFAEAGFRVIGVDVASSKVAAINAGSSPVMDVQDEMLKSLVDRGSFRATDDFDSLREADAIVISVPTPLTDGAPDLRMVVSAGESVGLVLKEGALVVLESTTYPGTTEELLQPLLEASGKKAGTDFYLAYSPERIDPGNETYAFTDIPKVVGGIDGMSTRAAVALYRSTVPKVVTVSGTREAELSKLIENTFRHVNIALVNELAIYSHEMGVDIWEAIEAAASKPFGFMPFWPGPGWGGHCIPLDPAYLSWRVRRDRAHEVRFVELAQAVNSEMPRHVVERISVLLNEHGKAINGARVLGVGVAYKGGTDDTRESAAVKVLARLMKLGAIVSYADPLVSATVIGGETLSSVVLNSDTLREQDLVVILAPQDDVDWSLVEREAPLVLDCVNALRKKGGKITRL